MYAGDEFYSDEVTSGVVEDEFDCSWCAGSGQLDRCDDPLGCPGPHDKWGGGCPCRPCAGTGLRSHQTVF